MTRVTTALAILVACIAMNNAAAAGPADEPAGVVTAFCDAVSSRNLDRVLGFLAPGGVQFGLRPAHTGMGGQAPSLTTDLRVHWSTIGPVLFSATKSYSRKAQVIDTRVDGDIATVWARVTTTTVRADKPETRSDEFVELYVLVRKDGQWKIGAIADNRRPGDVGLGTGR